MPSIHSLPSPTGEVTETIKIESFKETNMAVQQNRKTPSKRGMRRSHDSLKPESLSIDPTSGETHLRHNVSPDGFYRGRKVVDK